MITARKNTASDEEVISEACALVEERTGVQLGKKQFDMAKSRLRRRLADLGLANFEQYRARLRLHRDEEIGALVSLLTTHHTYFFREFSQFEVVEKVLPGFAERVRARGARKLEVWSAACSRGHEVYSLAMHLAAHWPKASGGLGFRVLGTDVDPESVRIAAEGVYRRDEIKEVPMAYLGDHWARGAGETSDLVKAKPSLREHCEFGVANLAELPPSDRKFDIIFCRNVFIYFSLDRVKSITQELLKRLHPGGILVIGLSESLYGHGLPLKYVAPSIYARQEDAVKNLVTAATAAPAKALRVVCIDDSPVILSLLKKVLAAEYGFEVAGTACNGEEGAELVKKLRPDLVTLDIHMPVCGGIDYLRRFHGPGSPPVVMVSSVSRDDAELARQALDLGANDFVEKPALNNLREKGEELRAKLKAALKGGKVSASIDREFAKPAPAPSSAGGLRVLAFSPLDYARVAPVWKELKNATGPAFLSVSAPESLLAEVGERIAREGGKVERYRFGAPLKAGLYLGSPMELASLIRSQRFEKVSVLCWGEPPAYLKNLTGAKQFQLLCEDKASEAASRAPQGAQVDAVPATSFVYLQNRFFSSGGKP